MKIESMRALPRCDACPQPRDIRYRLTICQPDRVMPSCTDDDTLDGPVISTEGLGAALR
jgi:hypothetical protein